MNNRETFEGNSLQVSCRHGQRECESASAKRLELCDFIPRSPSQVEFRNWETVSRATSSVHILDAIAAAIISASSIQPVRKALASGHLTISSNLIIDTIEHSMNVSISKYTLSAEKNDLKEDAAQHRQRIDGLDCRSIPCLSRRR